MAVNVVYQKH